MMKQHRMKNLAIAIVCGLLVCSSCSKSSNSSGGSWNFKGTNYSATSFAKSYSGVTVSSQVSNFNTNNYSTLNVSFYNGLPGTGGTFVVKPGVRLDSTNQVAISLHNIGANTDTLYQATGGNGNQTVYVTVSNGYINISGAGIELGNTLTPSDSGLLNLTLVQPTN
jgi:hypothetical protein